MMTIACLSSSLSSSPKLLHATSLLSPDMAFMWDTPSVESLRRLLSLTTTKTTKTNKTNCKILCTSRAHPVYTSKYTMLDLHCKALVDTALVQTADTVAVVARTRGRAEENVPDWCNLLLLGHGRYKHDILACIPSFTIIKRKIQAVYFSLGAGGVYKTDEFSEKFQTAFDPPSAFSENHSAS